VGHLHLLAIAEFTELAIPAMVVLGFQADPQFVIAETLQWCAQLELQKTWVNNVGVVRTLRFVSQCSTLGVSFTFSVSLSSSWVFCVAGHTSALNPKARHTFAMNTFFSPQRLYKDERRNWMPKIDLKGEIPEFRQKNLQFDHQIPNST